MTPLAVTLHVLAAVVWVGGMFFAYLAARPALAELETPLRARLWVDIFRRFFPWVWAAVIVLLLTGFYMIFDMFGGFAQAPEYIHIMMGLGILMMALFGHIYFSPYQRLRRSVETNDPDLAGKAMKQIRLIIAINLSLGLIVVAVVMLGTYSLFD